MKTITILGIFTLLSLSLVASEKHVEAPIKHVTVFVQGAQIERSVSTSLDAGVHEIVLEGLSAQIDEASIRAGGKGAFTLLSVKKRMNYLRNLPKPERMIMLEDSLTFYNEKIAVVEADKFGLEEEKKMILANYSLKGNEKNLTAEELKAMANFYRDRLPAIAKEVSKLTVTFNKLNNQRSKVQNELNKFHQNRNNPVGEIVLQLMTKQATAAKLKVLYTIRDAGWSPNYDIRSGGALDKVSVGMYAAVYQGTGIDWKKVPLTLSTSVPQQYQAKPELHPWVLNFIEVYQKSSMSNRHTKFQQPQSTSLEMAEDAVVEVAGNYAADFTQVIEQQLSTLYKVDLPYTISSNREEHQVLIRNFTVAAKSKYYAVPKRNQSAFLVAGLLDWEKENLMPGATKLFVDEMFVGRSYLNPATTEDTLLMSLGMDPEIVVNRKRVKDYSSEKVIGSNKKVTISIEISVKNTKSKAIELELQDQHPISSNNDISVSLDDDGNARVDEESGLMTWNWNLKPGETRKTRFTYTVKYPKDKMINL